MAANKEPPQPVKASELRFTVLRRYFEALQEARKRQHKALLTKRLLALVDRTSPDVAILVKLVQPGLDANRVFGIRQADLIKIFREFVPASEADELAAWRSSGGMDAGSFHQAARKVVYERRCRVTENDESNVTLGEINSVLDSLAQVSWLNTDERDDRPDGQRPSQEASQSGALSQRGPSAHLDRQESTRLTAKKQRAKILFGIMQKLTADEMTWLTRIILKDNVSAGYSHISFLRDFHEDAKRVYDWTWTSSAGSAATRSAALRSPASRLARTFRSSAAAPRPTGTGC